MLAKGYFEIPSNGPNCCHKVESPSDQRRFFSLVRHRSCLLLYRGSSLRHSQCQLFPPLLVQGRCCTPLIFWRLCSERQPVQLPWRAERDFPTRRFQIQRRHRPFQAASSRLRRQELPLHRRRSLRRVVCLSLRTPSLVRKGLSCPAYG